MNKQKTLFYVSSVQGNTVPSYVHLSINNVFIVKTNDTLKKCVERELLKKMFQHIHRILFQQMHQLEGEVEDFSLFAICGLNHNPAPPIKVNTKVNGFVIPMEGDTGTSTSLLNLDPPKDQY